MKKQIPTKIEPQIEDLLLEQRVEVIKEVRGNTVFHKHVAKALQEAQVLAGSDGIVAPLPLLVRSFPSLWMFYPESNHPWTRNTVSGPVYTANSEEHVGIDRFGKFYAKGEPIVVTIHGGLEGPGLLDAEALTRVGLLTKDNKDLIDNRHSVPLNAIYERTESQHDVLTDILHSGMPNGDSILVFSYEQYREEGAPGSKRHAVVRNFNQLRREDYKDKFLYGGHFAEEKHNLLSFLLHSLIDDEQIKVSDVQEIMTQSKIANEIAEKTQRWDHSHEEVWHTNGELLKLLKEKAKLLFDANDDVFLSVDGSAKVVYSGSYTAAEELKNRIDEYNRFMNTIHKTLPFRIRAESYFDYANPPETRSVILGVGYNGVHPMPLTKSGTYVVIKKDQFDL